MIGYHLVLPATTANLGAGFDTLGLALELYNEVRVCAARCDHTEIEGEGAGELPTDDTNLVRRAMRAFAERVKRELPPVALQQVNRIPLARGLGSSAAAIVGGLLAAQALLELAMVEDELLDLAIELEGHPDNVAPCLHGGLMVCCRDERGWHHVKLTPPPDLVAVLAIPEYTVSTQRARELLPDSVPRADALFNVSRAALFVAAIASGDLAALGPAMEDRLHQPYRAALVPGLYECIAAARQAGAFGAALSGAGPSVVALASSGGVSAVEAAMTRALADVGVTATTRVVGLDGRGAIVQSVEF